MNNPYRDNPEPEKIWKSLLTVSDLARNEEKETPNQLGNLNSAEGRALWRQRQAKQNMLAHQATVFLKERGLTWDGRSKKKIPGL
jgi:hypothetical protein